MQRVNYPEPEHSTDATITPADLRAVRALLAQRGLPAELVLQIIDGAEYYPVVRASLRGPSTLNAQQGCAKSGGSCAARCRLLSPPLPGPEPGETWRVRKVVWEIESRDQGWGGESPGTFRGAYSWYEACIVRPQQEGDDDSPPTSDGTTDPADERSAALAQWMSTRKKYCSSADALPDLEAVGYTLVPNNSAAASGSSPPPTSGSSSVTASRSAKADVNGYGSGAGFLEALRPGDRVALWMRAQYPGWANTVAGASVEIVYDVC
ncbi:hypothetical protein BN946_scf184781.g14 [Trametes cinnabarina]|uniref:Uncharacterized protein n=1 Tax=Pycnoporus cinnabarinus TaxID=5643 RepID=A0A060SPG8_PYCCI|nr:hypothetical protein BN946_scf184781.g14 [Trametes cinnabarina]